MRKCICALILALALCMGLTAPASAAGGGSESSAVVDVVLPEGYESESSVESCQLRQATPLTYSLDGVVIGTSITRGDAEKLTFPTVRLPLGTTINISGLRNDWSADLVDIVSVMVCSDPDGDGVYDQWIFDFENDPPVVPFEQESVAYGPSQDGRYSFAAFLTQDDTLTFDTSAPPSSVSIRTDYLNEVFGPNTMVMISIYQWRAVVVDPLYAVIAGVSTPYVYLLTGEEAGAPDASDASGEPDEPAAPAVRFDDVAPEDYYADAVEWAVAQGIAGGTGPSQFSPKDECTTAQILTFLWRAQGEPEPAVSNPFSDVKESDYYYKAALWAAEKGLVSGAVFGGNEPCTRAETMVYLWRLAGSPQASGAAFDDVPDGADYAQAVAYAVREEIAGGTGPSAFSPDQTCTRGQIMTFLYRAYAN